MNIFNRLIGALIGTVTGALTAALQIPYAYYVVARNMREAIRFDLFLMSTPENPNNLSDYSISDQNHLYLYKAADGKVFYYINENQQPLSFPTDEGIEFSSTKEKPIKCKDRGILKLVSDITSKKGHTQVVGYSLFATALATIIVGTLGAIITAYWMCLFAPFNIVLGARIGWNEGVTSAITFPNRFRAMSNFLRDHLRPLPTGGIFNPGPTSFNIVNDLNNLGKAGVDHWNHYSRLKYQEATSKIKVKIVNQIVALPTEHINPDFPFTEEQVQKFSKAVAAQNKQFSENKGKTDDPNYKKNVFLSEYLSSCCPLTLAQLYEEDLHETREQTHLSPDHIETNKIPITIECIDDSGGKTVATYNYDAFEAWLHTTLENYNIPDLLLPDRMLSLIDKSNQIKIYRGYSRDLDVGHILQVIEKWEKENTIITNPTPSPEMASLYSDSKPLPQLKQNIQTDTVEEKTRKALAREALLANREVLIVNLEKRNKNSVTPQSPHSRGHS